MNGSDITHRSNSSLLSGFGSDTSLSSVKLLWWLVTVGLSSASYNRSWSVLVPGWKRYRIHVSWNRLRMYPWKVCINDFGSFDLWGHSWSIKFPCWWLLWHRKRLVLHREGATFFNFRIKAICWLRSILNISTSRLNLRAINRLCIIEAISIANCISIAVDWLMTVKICVMYFSFLKHSLKVLLKLIFSIGIHNLAGFAQTIVDTVWLLSLKSLTMWNLRKRFEIITLTDIISLAQVFGGLYETIPPSSELNMEPLLF